MSRNLSNAFANAVTAGVVAPVMLMKAEFDSGDVLAWTGYGTITFGGDSYLGVGDFGGVDKVEESADVRANGAVLTLSGIPSDLIATALLEDYQGRPITLYLGLLNLTSGALIDSPYAVISGRMDVMSIEEGSDTATISLTVENNLIELTRSKERRYTHEDQLIDYPDDLGLEYVAGLQEKPLDWGVPNSLAGAPNVSAPPSVSDEY
jgi:hypothetical protein